MSRRRYHRRRRPARLPRPRTVALLGAAGGLWWLWVQHPAAVILLGVLAVPAGLAGWRARRSGWAWRRRPAAAVVDTRPVGVYEHFFTGPPPAAHLYTGITNDYDARCRQHAAESWWWPYVDHAQSRIRVFSYPEHPDPRAAARACEAALIAADCPIGNADGNPRYFEQQPYRRQLQAAVGWRLPVEALPARRRLGRRVWAT